MTEPVLVSTSDIAELVDERLPVVSTWRNRFKSGENAFPLPVGGSPSRPLFDLDQVRDWVSRNRPEKDFTPRLLPVLVWSAVRDLSDFGPSQYDLVHWVHLLLHVRKHVIVDQPASAANPVPTPETPLDELTSPLGAGAVRSVESLIEGADSADLVAISDFILRRLSAGYGRGGGDTGAVDSPISRILGEATRVVAAHWAIKRSDVREPVVYDPACGIGETLIQAHTTLGLFGRQAKLVGVDVNKQVAEIASIRLALRDIPSEIIVADSLATPLTDNGHPDLVVVEPPLGLKWGGVWSSGDLRAQFGVPSAASADLAWVVDAAARLQEDSRGYVLTSLGALSRGGVDERVRASLIRSGAVMSVIVLPPKLLQYTSMPLALWVLRAPLEEDELRPVNLLDASDPEIAEGGASDLAQWVRERIVDWIIDPLGADPAEGLRFARVYLHDLTDARWDLTPGRWTAEPELDGLKEVLSSAQSVLAAEVRGMPTEAPDFWMLPAAVDFVSIRDLTDFPDSREAKMWSGRGVSNDEVTPETITSRDIADRVIRPGLKVPQDSTGFWTQPGDIVFTTMTKLRAMVDVDGGHRIGNGVHALRLLESSRFEPEYVAMCLAAAWNRRFLQGATIKHVRPGDLEIPLLSRPEQQAWMAQLSSLSHLIRSAESVITWAADVEKAAQNFLRFGQGQVDY